MEDFLKTAVPDTPLAKAACSLAEKFGLTAVSGYNYDRCQFVAAFADANGNLSWMDSGGTQEIAYRLSLNSYLSSVSPSEDFLHMTDEEVISRI